MGWQRPERGQFLTSPGTGFGTVELRMGLPTGEVVVIVCKDMYTATRLMRELDDARVYLDKTEDTVVQ